MVVINITGQDYHVRSYRGDYSYDARQGILSIPVHSGLTLEFMHPILQSFEHGKLTFLAIEKSEEFNTARLITIEST